MCGFILVVFPSDRYFSGPPSLPSYPKGTYVTFLFINVNHDVGYESSESIPISLGYILATLKASGRRGVIIDDLQDRPITLGVLERYIRQLSPTVVGFTAYQSTMERIRFLCRYIKSAHRDIFTVLGGPQAVKMPAQALEQLPDVDALTRGEGELVMPALAEALETGRPLDTVEGLACRSGEGIVDGEIPSLPDDLDRYASPYLSGLINLEGKDTAILLSSRGCGHRCLFCITPDICGGRVRYHSVERTLDEMSLLADKGIGRFWFADPNFTENRERTETLLRKKIERGITTPFWAQTRVDLVDSEMLKLLKEAGADTIAFGLESGSPGVLKGTNKRIVLDQAREHTQTAQSLEMDVELFSVFGLPGETVENARETLEFVRSLGIPIQMNSGSQQMQLYYGSTYERNPQRWGFRPYSEYIPTYMSVGDRYETNRMSRADMKKVRNIWTLANEQMEMDVYYKQNIFDVLDFLLTNKADLMSEVNYYVYGALACCAIEEYSLLREFLNGFETFMNGDRDALSELIAALIFFKESDEPAGPEDRVIFDARSFMDGVPFIAVSGKYWDVLLGKGLLLESFEKAFVGACAGDELNFSFTFPDDYQQEELRGKQPEVHAQIRKIFRPFHAQTIDDVREFVIGNSYDFSDYDLLSEKNDILYYLALKSADPQELVRTPTHFLSLALRKAKLGMKEEVDRLAELIRDNPSARMAIADTLSGSGKCSWAFEHYQALSKDFPSSYVKMAECLLEDGKPGQACEVLESSPGQKSLEYQQTLLECLKKGYPDSDRIPSLERRVLDLKVRSAVDRERMSPRRPSSATPIVHGMDER